MSNFDDWLMAKNIDQQQLTRELRQALLAQFEAEQSTRQPETLIVIPDGCDSDQWQRAVRMELARA